MTSLISWLSVDSRGPTAIYLLSDSRISWGTDQNWDCGRKVFSVANSPEIFGYFGDVLFPSLSLSVIQNLIEHQFLFMENDCPEDKKNKIFRIILRNFEEYPKNQIATDKFTIVYCTKENCLMESIYHVYSLNWSRKEGFHEEKLDLPERSGIIGVWGSGESSIIKWHERWQKTTEKGTSRSIFSAFCDSLAMHDDPYSNGPPQLVGIYRKGNGQTIGVLYNDELYAFGQRTFENNNLGAILWHNSKFERIDFKTKEPLSGAQHHRIPKGLGLSK